MELSDGMDKSWDHPWTTEEMRKKRKEWSLAGDVGLLKHLQQFSDNLTSKTNKTLETLDSLTTQLSETAILVDNLTNTSLALANTQFIESRVQEDDVEIEKKADHTQQDLKDQDLSAANVIANVSESIRQGLRIMDEKYKKMEVENSDSEDEDNPIVLRPNDPYQDRPLPYIIGSDKWKASHKIGLESSSSSESEQVDEEESESDKDDKDIAQQPISTNGPKKHTSRLSSSSSELDNYNDESNSAVYANNEKFDDISQITMNSGSETSTPIKNASKVRNETTPNFAEELAKRLGNVRQAQKPPTVDESKEPSINRFKDDLFTPEDGDVFGNEEDNLFSENQSSFDDKPPKSLWREKPTKSFTSNIIPPSIDVPPPISTVSTKPKSAIDDLFADADSEDSDDIFSSKATVKRISKSNSSSNVKQAETDNAKKKYLDIVNAGMVSSTPEMHANAGGLFSDDGDNDNDLFGTANTKSRNFGDTFAPKSQSTTSKKSIGGVPTLGKLLTAELESTLSSKLFRHQSSESSTSDTTPDHSSIHTNGDNSHGVSPNDNANERSIISAGFAQNLISPNEDSRSSGISIKPPSIDNTAGSSLGVDFQPQMTSSRLRSEEIYQERKASDSLFLSRNSSRAATSGDNTTDNKSREQNTDDSSSMQQQRNDVFENEDLFGPPPLPKADSKAPKSKAKSLFDDSDSGDELFSTASSGSRSQKSTDFLATTPQYTEKVKATNRKGLFDDDVDSFGAKDSPDVDIFGSSSAKSPCLKEEPMPSSRKSSEPPAIGKSAEHSNIPKVASGDKVPVTKPAPTKTGLFDDDDHDDNDGDDDLFGVKPSKATKKSEAKVFEKQNEEEEDEADLFSSKGTFGGARKIETTSESKEMKSVEPKMEGNGSGTKVTHDERKSSEAPSRNGLFSRAVNAHGLLFEDDDYDDLFAKKGDAIAKVEADDGRSRNVAEAGRQVELIKETKITSVEEVEEKKPAKPPVAPKTFHAAGKKVEPVVTTETVLAKEKGTEKVTEREEPAPPIADGGSSKKHPPKTLNIRAAVTAGLDDGNQAPRRAVSGKIKDLMGKMGDFKILSPTDTPPLWRRSEEKTDEEEDVGDRDSDDGGCISTHSKGSPSSGSAPPPKQSPQSKIPGGSNEEVAISFDEPAQVETLSTTASKSRARIQAKRRPQSRHARKSALRQSGIDFDTVDTTGDVQEEKHSTELLDGSNRKFTIKSDSMQSSSSVDRLVAPAVTSSEGEHRSVDSNTSLVADDRSELGSISKESSMSANKNTLLSPSTDEEDLFDVPPDLPEDPQREDTLFGRAPILSPIDSVLSQRTSNTTKSLRDPIIGRSVSDDDEDMVQDGAVKKRDSAKFNTVIVDNNDRPAVEPLARASAKAEFKEENATKDERKEAPKDKQSVDEAKSVEETSDEPIDPLRDSSHDPLKDPSQLFAFVTKTPSPEKGKNLLFSEDDSLFASGTKKIGEVRVPKKQVLDLFADVAGGDLFSAPFTTTVKKPAKDSKVNLFDDDAQIDEDDSLFGSIAKKVTAKGASQKSSVPQSMQKRRNLFDDEDDDDDDDTNLFADVEPSLKADNKKVPEDKLLPGNESVKTSRLDDIFGDQSSGEEDIFATKKTIIKKAVQSKSLFGSDDDDDDMFGKPSSSNNAKVKIGDSRPTVKKAVTRDLRKTAEKIVEDPLSILQDE